MVGENADFLAKVTRLDGVNSYHFFLFHLHIVNILLVLLLLADHVIKSELRFSQILLEIVDQSSVVLLLIFKPLGVLLFPLS